MRMRLALCRCRTSDFQIFFLQFYGIFFTYNVPFVKRKGRKGLAHLLGIKEDPAVRYAPLYALTCACACRRAACWPLRGRWASLPQSPTIASPWAIVRLIVPIICDQCEPRNPPPLQTQTRTGLGPQIQRGGLHQNTEIDSKISDSIRSPTRPIYIRLSTPK